MSIEFACECGKKARVRDEYAGSPVRCSQCGRPNKVPKPGEMPPAPVDPYGLDEGTRQRKEYKVVTQRDFILGGKFEPERIEQVLNAYAKKGWVVRSGMTAGIASIGIGAITGGSRDEIIIILERETD